MPVALTDSTDLPRDFAPWWQDKVRGRLETETLPLRMKLDKVILGTLLHSPQVKVFSDSASIRDVAVVESEARFDPRAFVDSKFVDTNDPVGSTLTTGGARRFIDQNLYAAQGLRKRTAAGGQIEASQRFGYEQNNSIFFQPKPQGTARLALNYTQPLLNGAGRAYNHSLTVLAQIDADVARDQLSLDLQAFLLDVHRAYWDLYLQRAVLLQKRALHRQAVDILAELEARREVDVLSIQLVRARAAVSAREAATIRFATSVKNAEARLRSLVNDPELFAEPWELVPLQVPSRGRPTDDVQVAMAQALEFRPEINQAAREVRAAHVKSDVACNELLPVLNLIVGTYTSGLRGHANSGQAWVDQFSVGRPTYFAGLLFEKPFGNRAAKSRQTQRRLELRLATNSFQTTVARVRAEVEIAVREVETTYREMVSKQQAMLAEQADIDYLLERWRLLPGDQQAAGFVLDRVLEAQERLAEAEFGFASAEVAFNVALIQRERATGTLLRYEEIVESDTVVDGLPTRVHSKPLAAPAPEPQARLPRSAPRR